jgi:hypothetical protein
MRGYSRSHAARFFNGSYQLPSLAWTARCSKPCSADAGVRHAEAGVGHALHRQQSTGADLFDGFTETAGPARPVDPHTSVDDPRSQDAAAPLGLPDDDDLAHPDMMVAPNVFGDSLVNLDLGIWVVSAAGRAHDSLRLQATSGQLRTCGFPALLQPPHLRGDHGHGGPAIRGRSAERLVQF